MNDPKTSAKAMSTSSSSSIKSIWLREHDSIPRIYGSNSDLVLSGPNATAIVPKLLTELILQHYDVYCKYCYLFFWSSLFSSSINTAIG